MTKPWIFDSPLALRFTERRQAFFNQFLPLLIQTMNLKTALDVGCGVGLFSNYLKNFGLTVTAVDGRSDNIEEARRRYPGIHFQVADVENHKLTALGQFDLTLCIGLLYHLENPLRAIRNFAALTQKILIAESIVIPHRLPMAAFVEECFSEDQGLNYVALIPSEAALIKMFQHGGLRTYRTRSLPDHEDFKETVSRKRVRTILIGSKLDLQSPLLEETTPPRQADLWGKWVGQKWEGLRSRVRNGIRSFQNR